MSQDVKRTELSDEELKTVTGGITPFSNAAVCANMKNESDCVKMSTCKWTGNACEADNQSGMNSMLIDNKCGYPV